MSLRDKYGGNVDMNAKYGRPKPEKHYDPTTTADIRPGFDTRYIPTNLQKDIRKQVDLNKEYIDFLVDAKNYIRNYKSAYEVFINRRRIDFRIQALSQDHHNVLLVPLQLTEESYECGDWYEVLKDPQFSQDEFKKYYALSSGKQKYAIFRIKSGTFSTYFDELYTDIDTTNIYFFSDGAIYCTGSEYLQNIGIDLLSNLFDEGIGKLNNGTDYENTPYMEARIFYENDFSIKNIKERRKYILKTSVGNPNKR